MARGNGNETLSYLILQKLERFPEQKEVIKIFNEDGKSFIFNIEKMTENTIKIIKIDISKSL
jgi:Mg2+/Co2+ transporter CorB